jgi:hypothetical protein
MNVIKRDRQVCVCLKRRSRRERPTPVATIALMLNLVPLFRHGSWHLSLRPVSLPGFQRD